MRNTIIIFVAIIVFGGILYLNFFSGNENENTNESSATISNTTANSSTNTNNTKINEGGSLIAHWEFDEGTGNVVTDSANNIEGSLIGDIAWEEGKVGNALLFDGIDDFVKFSQEAIDLVNNLNQGTIAFWFKYSSTLDKQTIMPIMHYGSDSVTKDDNMLIIELGHSDTNSEVPSIDQSNKKLYATWIENNNEPVLCYDTSVNMEENTWYHYALVVGSDGNTGYLNGVELDNRNYNFGLPTDQLFFSAIPFQDIFTLGYGKTHHQISPEFVYYTGYLDDFRIYNEPLTVSEVMDIIK